MGGVAHFCAMQINLEKAAQSFISRCGHKDEPSARSMDSDFRTVNEDIESMVESTAETVLDEAVSDETVPDVSYDVTSYGSDPDVEGLVRRMKREEILVPPFQRDYVWRQPEASRFIESLLLGLPVPGIFLATDPVTNKLLVIDGQQRLKTLLFFYEGFFNPKAAEKRQRVFRLQKVQPRFEGKSYSELDERDRIRLGNSILHATIVKQTSPPEDDTSVYHIFARLNSGGRRLAPQEIRVALYHGPLMELLRASNEHESWRKIFGKPHSRLKDQELVLRFLALYHDGDRYTRPMEEFLNLYAGRNREPGQAVLGEMQTRFERCADLFWSALGREVFRPARALNAAVFDSCMVGLASRLEVGATPDEADVKSAYQALLKDEDYIAAVSRSTADETFVDRRLKKSRAAFAAI